MAATKAPRVLHEDDLRRIRVRAQLLHRPRGLGAAEVVRRLCGIQAQDLSAARLAVRARAAGSTAAGVDRARVRDRAIVWTWAMRGTLHLLAAEDVDWVLPLVAPTTQARSRRRLSQLGIAADAQERAVRAVVRLLEHGPLTRAEVVEGLMRRGIRAQGQASIHLILRAAMDGLVCRGPDRGREPTYVLLRDWIDGPSRTTAPEGETALAELARRYLAAYGPADAADLAAWSGLGLRQARAAWDLIGDGLREVRVGGTRRLLWMLRSQRFPSSRAAPAVRLVPAFDTYLLGYRNRADALDSRFARRVHPGGGIVHPAALIDGRVVGTWRIERRRNGILISVEPFEPVKPATRRAFDAEAHDIARFLGTETAELSTR